MARPRCRAETVGVSDFITPATIKRVPTAAKFDIRALKAANGTSYFGRLEAL
jgi:hypothetical protein